MAEFGLPLGLSVDLQYDQRINDLRYREQQNQRAKAMAEVKASLFASDMDYQNAINSYDSPRIKEFAKGQIKKIGQFINENPDWQVNLDKRMQLNQLKKELKDNQGLHRGLASDAARKQYLADRAEVAKNPQQHDVDAYNAVDQEWNNYLQYGNQYGADAAKAQGEQAFVYTKPRDFVDLNKAFQETGNSFKDMKTRPIKGGRNAYEEFANPESLRAISTQMYGQNKRQIDLEAQKRGVDPMAFVESGINAHIPKKRDFGDYGLSDGIALANYKKRLDGLDRDVKGSAYQEAFVNAPQGVVNPAFLEQTYGSKPRNILYNNKGQGQIDNTGNRVYYTGAHKWVETKNKSGQPQKQKLVEIYSYLTPEQAAEKGIYDDGKWNPFKGEEITPEWNKQAELVTTQDKDGKDVKAVKVKSFMPVELNSAYAGAFDNEVHIAKSKLMGAQPNENAGQDVPTGTVNDWKASGWSDAQIQEGVNSGKIKVK
jgi:hypothetical protein